MMVSNDLWHKIDRCDYCDAKAEYFALKERNYLIVKITARRFVCLKHKRTLFLKQEQDDFLRREALKR